MPQHWSDWPRWLEAMKLGGLVPAATLSFGHYDQVIQAALDGAGVALGRHLLVARHLDNGTLVAPFGRERSVAIGGRYVVATAAHAAERPAVRVFVEWLLAEARDDGAGQPRAGGGAGAAKRSPAPPRAG